MIISNATMANWERLMPDTSQKLKRGANKTLSAEKVCPKEYITCAQTHLFLEQFLSICDEENISIEVAVYSLAVRLLERKGILNAEHVKKTLQSYIFPINEKIYDLDPPAGERDILGIAYQCLLSEGEKNISGSYYTPFHLISEMLKDIELNDKSFLDPCCGSGAFLLSVSPKEPTQLWGCDRDPIAAMIAKINLLCKFSDFIFIPHVFCCDYLAEFDIFSQGNELFQKRFDFIATNPPWGAKGRCNQHCCRDSFSRFFIKAHDQLVDGGRLVFLFPEAVLNVKTHLKIREILLTKTHLNLIRLFEGNFSGVMTKYVSVDIEKRSPVQTFLIKRGETVLQKKTKDILTQKDKIISFSDGEDEHILGLIDAAKKYDLSTSTFALGIVTGNNKEKISQIPFPGMEPIYTGKDVDRYVLKKAQNYIVYDREKFQQAAKDEYYRAPEKLVYKFISKQIVFSYDNSQSLFLNSANILIPSIPGYGIKTVLAFLDSELLRYYYMKSFKDIKILKNNLCQLPFPEITENVNHNIEQIVDHILHGDCSEEELLQKLIFHCYHLNEEQILHIRSTVDPGKWITGIGGSGYGCEDKR